MIYPALIQEDTPDFNTRTVLTIVLIIGLALIVLSHFYIFFEQRYALRYLKPFFKNLIIFNRKLNNNQLKLLEHKFSFYKKLDPREQRLFRHRLATFIKQKQFISKEELQLSDEIKVLVSATAVMLTFGFRNYLLDLFGTIIIYPSKYYSTTNDAYHKGETNPKYGTIVFSWEHFERGYQIGDDNLNLGIHEFGHGIHLNAYKNSDVSSLIFKQGFQSLTNYLQNNEAVRIRLLESRYFREYAYTNQYEFFAVLLENFIETPIEFKAQFPKLYLYMKQMLNFNFAGY